MESSENNSSTNTGGNQLTAQSDDSQPGGGGGGVPPREDELEDQDDDVEVLDREVQPAHLMDRHYAVVAAHARQDNFRNLPEDEAVVDVLNDQIEYEREEYMQTHGCDDFEEYDQRMDLMARKTIIKMRESNLLVQFPQDEYQALLTPKRQASNTIKDTSLSFSSS